ncbi:MAG: ATP-binding cassette domain-containing protein, partial [Oscillospiraceae bacterium]
MQKNINLGYLDQYINVEGNLGIFDYSKEENYNNSELMEKASDYQSLLINCEFYEIESNILKVADGLGVTALGMETKMGELSGGQKAKVILSKLLLGNYDLLLLDEPTNFLDKQHVEWLSEYLKSFKGA